MEIDLDELREGFSRLKFMINEENLFTVYLALRLERPLLVGGPPGVGKTELAKVLSRLLGGMLIRLQCHEGLDESSALYDWNIQRQLVKIQLAARDGQLEEEELFSRSNLLERPLLQAITSEEQVVLLIDEIDRSSPGFEAFVLEVLSDFQISIPEIGTITATHKPVVVITNNGERELTEPLRRRCVFLYLDFPAIKEEAAILQNRVPDVLDNLKEKISMAVAWSRDQGYKLGSAAPATLDWARALLSLSADHYQRDYVERTLITLGENRENLAAFWDQIIVRQEQEKEDGQRINGK